MAATELSVQSIDFTGAVPTFTGANVDGNFFTNDGITAIIVDNADASPMTVTVDSISLCNQGFDHNQDIVIANGTQQVIGFFSKKRFNDTSQFVQLSYSSITSVTVAVLSFPT